jgi:phage terminase small subunit
MTELEYGPAMAALNERQRRFVLAMASDPFGSAARWARTAGYSDTANAAKVSGHHLIHDARIEAAVFEVARACMSVQGPLLAMAGLLRMARDKNHPKHARAIEMLANRVGLHEVQEVRVHRTDMTGEGLAARIKALAKDLGMDPAQLLGVNAAGPAGTGPKLIEGEVVEVGSDEN